MKHFSIFILFTLLTASVHAQQIKQPVQTKEYATVYLRVNYQGNNIVYDKTGLSKSPVISMPDGKSYMLNNEKEVQAGNKGEFNDVGQVLNYMAAYGWTLVTSNALFYDAREKDKSVILNTNEYVNLLTFERPYQSKTP
jgi:hypothetical protein